MHAIKLTVAVTVPLEFGRTTCVLEVFDASIAFGNVRAVQTFACFAVPVVFGTATITAIPSASSVVTTQNNM